MQHKRPEEVFRAEKERALGERNSQHARLLAEAKAAFEKLMAEGQAARKSGRPRKHPLPPLKTGSALRPQQTPPSFAAVPSLANTMAVVPVAAPVVAQAAKSAKSAKSKAKPKAKAKVGHK